MYVRVLFLCSSGGEAPTVLESETSLEKKKEKAEDEEGEQKSSTGKRRPHTRRGEKGGESLTEKMLKESKRRNDLLQARLDEEKRDTEKKKFENMAIQSWLEKVVGMTDPNMREGMKKRLDDDGYKNLDDLIYIEDAALQSILTDPALSLNPATQNKLKGKLSEARKRHGQEL